MQRTVPFLLSFVALAQGYTTFSTNCSTPTTTVNFVSSPNSRGTLNLLWSNLFTLFACTWTIQHLNVPEQRNGRDPGWRGDLKWGLKSFWSSAKWMFVTAIAPEVLLTKAWSDLHAAKKDTQKLQRFAEKDRVPWTLTHSLLANMGGFVIRWNMGERALKNKHDASTQTSHNSRTPVAADDSEMQHHNPNTQAAGYDAVMVDQDEAQARLLPQVSRYSASGDNGSYEDRAQIPAEASYANPFHLLAPDILVLREKGLLNRLPYLTIEEINDKSKSDGLARAIAAGQIAWTAIQIIARAVRRLAISQLEITIMAFAVCAIIIYALNWQKPKGVRVPYTLLEYTDRLPRNVDEIILDQRKAIDEGLLNNFLGFYQRDGQRGAPTSNLATRTDMVDVTGLVFGCAIFGGLHLAAWNFRFPSKIEQIVWRATGLWCTLFMIVWFLSIMSLALLDKLLGLQMNEKRMDKFLDRIVVIFILLYALARLFLLVECFRTLLFLPPDVYKTIWASNIPHVA